MILANGNGDMNLQPLICEWNFDINANAGAISICT